MPQSTQKTLVRVLLWWTAILSITQAVFVVLFFTLGHFGQSQDSSAAMKIQGPSDKVDKPISKPGVSLDKAKMFTFKNNGAKVHPNHTITWYAADFTESRDLPTDEGNLGVINIKKDGYFFMCLRVTLTVCNVSVDKWTVTLEENNDPILVGWINNKTCSTGVLCKIKRLESENTLKVKMSGTGGQSFEINDNQKVTYLEMFYMPI